MFLSSKTGYKLCVLYPHVYKMYICLFVYACSEQDLKSEMPVIGGFAANDFLSSFSSCLSVFLIFLLMNMYYFHNKEIL